MEYHQPDICKTIISCNPTLKDVLLVEHVVSVGVGRDVAEHLGELGLVLAHHGDTALGA